MIAPFRLLGRQSSQDQPLHTASPTTQAVQRVQPRPACIDGAAVVAACRSLLGCLLVYATASLTAFTGRALITFLAGLALNTVGSFVKGLMPSRAFVAGFLMTTNFANPGTKARSPPTNQAAAVAPPSPAPMIAMRVLRLTYAIPQNPAAAPTFSALQLFRVYHGRLPSSVSQRSGHARFGSWSCESPAPLRADRIIIFQSGEFVARILIAANFS